MSDDVDELSEAARYWARRWREDGLDGGPDWTVEGPGRPRVLDRAEMLIRRPPRLPPSGPLRDEILLRRRLAELDLERLDLELGSLLERRRHVTDRIEATTLALTGTARILPVPSTSADTDGPTECAQPDRSSLSGRELRRLAVGLVFAADKPLDLDEIRRLLALQGLAIAGRPSQTLSNALRPAVARGKLIRLAPGTYAPARVEAA